ncbi:epimerase [Maritimibacter sp. 55A14]|uniref:epimerase n=1 Tax=Maritimibacter sp. 55A14 TaxID=2174844 RepID=UPI000D60A92E|nr:epimerase [Maritimibacter sp. 55A14]PWE33615.1 epimerase [Maritimibacter sp. 55A14]
MSPTVLILGANGRFGRNAAEAFWNAGWTVRRFDRAHDDLNTAAAGTDVILNAWNPPYPDWAAQVPALTRRVIDAARTSGASVLMPGNVYVFGADAPAVFGPATPHRAANPLGRIRIGMEAAYRASGVQTIILRAGDFLDTEPSGNWFDKVLASRIGRGVFRWPGDPDAPHAWAYLPDMARAAVALAEKRADLARFEDVPYPGYTLSGNEMAAALARATGRPVRLRRMSWLPLRLARPFWPMARHLIEMSYLWSKPHRIDPARFRELLPEYRATPPETALRRAVSFDIHPDQPVARTVTA